MLVTGENRTTGRKTCPSDILFTTNPTWTELGWNKCLRRERLTTNSLQIDANLQRVTNPNFVALNNLILTEEDPRAWGSVVVKALRWLSDGLGIDSRWCHW